MTSLRCIAVLLTLASPRAARGGCPMVTIEVDNDVAGSGYSEIKPENWVSHDVEPCKVNYRYLSETAGDGTRIGKAIWAPKIATTGLYEVTTSYRGSVNRSDMVTYRLEGDDAKAATKIVDQTTTIGCTKVVIGNVWCTAGGACRLVLDGNNGKSPAADVTTFRLVSCDPPATSPCDAIAAHMGWEVCGAGPSTCEGTFSDGAGCVALCAAAGMVCTARFGGSPGCSKEATTIPCDAKNGDASDYCVCGAPPGAGGAAGSGGSPNAGNGGSGAGGVATSAGSGGAGLAGAGGGGTNAGVAGSATNAGASGVAQGGKGGVSSGTGSAGFPSGIGGKGGALTSVPARAEDAGSSGGCVVVRGKSPSGGGLLALGLGGLWVRRRARRR